jgi:hypothetical protein
MKLMTLLLGVGALSASAMGSDLQSSGLIVLNPSSDRALEMVGNSTVRIAGRAVFVNSNHDQAVRTTGNATLDCPTLNVVGGCAYSGGSGCTGATCHPAVGYADPLSGLQMPNANNMTALPAQNISGGARMLGPGYYANGISITGNASVTLMPGTYIIGGSGFSLTSGSVVGTGVTLVMLNGALNLGGNGVVQLTAQGGNSPLASVVICQPASNHSQMNLSGNTNMFVAGAIYAPGALINLVGTSTGEADGPMMGYIVIADKVRLAGNGNLRIGNPDMIALVPPKLPFAD